MLCFVSFASLLSFASALSIHGGIVFIVFIVFASIVFGSVLLVCPMREKKDSK